MPFGYSCEYPDFDACVSDNQDRDDPEAFCGALMRETEERCRQQQDQLDSGAYI